MTSPCLTLRLWRTTRFIRAEPSSRSSSASTMRTVSFRFFPFTKTVSPRKSWRVSMVLLERAMMELSSLTASVTLLNRQCMLGDVHQGSVFTYISEFGFFFFFRIAVAVSSFCGRLVVLLSELSGSLPTSLCSAPDGSLEFVNSCRGSQSLEGQAYLERSTLGFE